MARPSRYADPRQHILDAARDLVAAQGFDAVSLRAVARAAGFSPPALYAYFADKQALLTALAEEANARLHTALSAAAAPGVAGLKAIGLAYVAFARAHPERFLLLFSRGVSRRRSLDDAVPAGSAYSVLLDAVAAAVDAGAVTARVDAEAITYSLWALAHGQAMLQLTTLEGFETDFPAADAVALDLLLAGLTGGIVNAVQK